MPVTVAIVGTGPAGFYTAESLLRSGLDARIDLIERLPTPFGLVRGGVAPDHQKTKQVIRAYERTAGDARVRYYGHVEVGADVGLAELRALYDAVVLAIGAPGDRRLGIPGEDKQNVFGSAAFVGWYNGHPDYRDLAPDLNVEAAAVVGNGNVALDIARVLAKTPKEMAHSDIAEPAARAIRGSPLADIYVLGRRGPGVAKFSNPELSEMGRLADALPRVYPSELPEGPPDDLPDRDQRRVEKNLATFRAFQERRPAGEGKRLHFVFYAKPLEVLGGERVAGLRLARTQLDEDGRVVETDERLEIACGLLVTAIGYDAPVLENLPCDRRGGRLVHEDGCVEPGLYVVGWCRRGPTGVIGTNKADGAAAARRIAEEVAPQGKPGGDGLERLLAERGLRWIDLEDWHAIDAAERAAATGDAPRRKFLRVRDMLQVLDRDRRAAGER